MDNHEKPEMTTAWLPLDDIRIDGGTQSRTSINPVVVEEYADALRNGARLPPITVFDDEDQVWLADGFHRLGAHRAALALTIECEVRFGSQSDAILFSAGANAHHGLRRTNDDKRRSVSILLGSEVWSKWSDREIARHCGVGNKFVGDVRTSICVPNTDTQAPATRLVERNGTTYEQNTANIGKARPAQAGGQNDPKAAETRMDTDFTPVVEHGESAQGGPVSASTKPLITNGSAIDFPTISASAGPVGGQVAPDDDFGPSPEEIAAAVRADAEQLEYIKNLLASDDDPLALALADLKRKSLEISALRSQNAGHQNTINDQIRMIKALRSKLAKLEAAK